MGNTNNYPYPFAIIGVWEKLGCTDGLINKNVTTATGCRDLIGYFWFLDQQSAQRV